MKKLRGTIESDFGHSPDKYIYSRKPAQDVPGEMNILFTLTAEAPCGATFDRCWGYKAMFLMSRRRTVYTFSYQHIK